MSTLTITHPFTFEPRQIHSIEETGLSPQLLADLALKIVHHASTVTGYQVAQRMKLPFVGVVDSVLDSLRRDGHVEVRGGNALTSASYVYSATGKGAERAAELIERCAYIGPAPVSMGEYWEMVRKQSVTQVSVDRAQVRAGFRDLVVTDRLLDQLGPAINAAHSIFLFGPPGNGKTSLAEIAATLLGGAVYVPYALEYDGQIMRVFDAAYHAPLDEEEVRVDARDRRWVRSRRPLVEVGGELTLHALDPVYSETGKFYEAPLQVKANCGTFLIDDFGRQQVSPSALLNRWIVPLEKRQDYLLLRTGHEIAVPFDQLVVFSTNLEPRSLVDEAFLRRIRYKIGVPNPTVEQYAEIFRRVCLEWSLQYEPEAARQVLDYCERHGIEPRCCHPRDLVDHVIHTANYLETPPRLSADLLEAACRNYFVSL